MKKLVLFLSFITLVLIGANSTFACSCMEVSPTDAFNNVKNTYIAKVKKVENESRKNKVSLEILEVFAGKNDNNFITTNSDSASCGVNFEVGETYIIYENNGNVNLCSGTINIKNGEKYLKALAGLKKQYSSKEIFEKVEGENCISATDGCNSLIMKDGKIIGSTKMACQKNHTPKYECREFKKATQENLITCTMEYDPVCGKDGKTYSNTCIAGKMEIVHSGECKKENGLVESLNNELENLKKELGEISQKIDKNIEKYKKVLNKYSPKIKVSLNKKVIKKIQHIEDKLFEGQPVGSKLPKEITDKFNLLRYLELKLEVIQNSFGVKNSENVGYCDETDDLNQCKVK